MTPEQMTDIVLLGGAVVFGAYGLMRGAIRQVGSVAAFIGAFICCRAFGASVAESLGWSQAVAMTVVFVVAFVTITLISRVLKLTAHLLLMGPVDRALGMVVGVFKWVFGASLILNILYFCNSGWPIFQSAIAEKVMRVAPCLFGMATEYFQKL